jgi:hypothetical protein
MSALKEWLYPWLSEYQWFREWYGGKWSRWWIDLPLSSNHIWVNQWSRPGCGLYWVEREDYESNPSKGASNER